MKPGREGELRGAGPGGVPVGTLTLEVSRRCPRHCAFCYVPADERADPGRGELRAEVLVRLATEILDQTGCRHVQLSGGEPLLRPDLLEIVDGLSPTGARVSLISDGGLLDAPLAQALVDRGVGPFQPTLLAGSAAGHDALRGEGSFAATTRAIALAARAGLSVSVCMVVTRRNFSEAAAVAELAFALGASGLALSRFLPVGPADEAREALSPEAGMLREAADAAAKVGRARELPLNAAVTVPACVWEEPEAPPMGVGVCSLLGPRTTATLGPDGSIRSCSMSPRTVGNLLHESWEVLAERLWRTELEPLRRSHAKSCGDCSLLSRCLGGCPLSVDGASGEGDPLADPSRFRVAPESV